MAMDALFHLYELPVPVVETYRIRQISPRMSIDIEVDYEDGEPGSARVPDPSPSSDRWHRARCWSSEDYEE
jgi:hypothetical protein